MMRVTLAAAHPEIAAQWHPDRNGGLSPSDVSPGSGKRVWWLDTLGHEWQATVNNRQNGTGCPYCSNTRVLQGFNDLESRRPAIAVDWHPALNGQLTPRDVAPHSAKKVWWRCPSGHDYQMTLGNRCSLGQGCPVCAGQRVLPGLNDMATTAPTLAAQWHPTLNAPLTPRDVFRSTAKRFWWLDGLGHEWEASANERSNGLGCPYCSGQRILIGFNDLATRRPDLAAEWHPSRNQDRAATAVTVMNGTRAWWRCSTCAHEWGAIVSSRSAGSGCPACAGQTVRAGVNDLVSQRPAVALSWHPTRNGADEPSRIAVFSNRQFWWQCSSGHEWLSTVNNRSHGQGCPVCADRGGFNPGRPGYVYFLEHIPMRAFKVGITNVGTNRLAMFESAGWTIVNLELFDKGHDAAAVERAIKSWWRRDLGLPAFLGAPEMPTTGGWTETVDSTALTSRECIERIQSERRALVSS
jgi:hypothetical protein